MSLLLLFGTSILGPLPGIRTSWGTPQDEVTIYDRGGVNPRRLLVAQAACSYELSAAGMFSAFASLHAIQDAGLPSDLKGSWLEWESPVGTWGGVITGKPVTDGVAEIAAMSYAVLLRGRVIMFNVRPPVAPAGAIVRRMIQEVTRDYPLFITPGVIDEDGPPMAMAFAGMDVFNDVLPSLAADSGHEWAVTADRALNFSRHIGEDRSMNVRLVEGRHIASYRMGDDLWLQANSLLGASAATEVESKKWMEDVTSTRTVPATGHWEPIMRRAKRRTTKNKKGWLWYQKPTGRNKWIEEQPAYIETITTPTERTLTTVDPFVALGFANTASINKYGLLEAIRLYTDTRDMETIGRRLENELATMINPPVPMELTVVDIDNCYRRFAEGDVIWVDIGSAALSGAFRVIHRTYDSGGLQIAGDLRPVGR